MDIVYSNLYTEALSPDDVKNVVVPMATPPSLYLEYEENGITYSLDLRTDSAVVSACIPNDEGKIIIPSYIMHGDIKYTVTSIAEKAFNNAKASLKSITIPNSITYIGENAFHGLS